MRMRRNFESLSFLLVSRCFRTATAFLTRCQRSSGMDGANPIPKQKGKKTANKCGINGRERKERKGEQIAEEEGVRRRTVRFEDTEDLVSCDEANLRDAVRVAEGDTD